MFCKLYTINHKPDVGSARILLFGVPVSYTDQLASAHEAFQSMLGLQANCYEKTTIY